MDKFEYKVRADEIRNLISQGQFANAAEIADTIDWSRVKKPTILCTVSDLYKKVKRYEDALELLQMAYDRYPGGKDIVYSMCELYLKTGDTIQAISMYKEFCQIAGNDIRRYILQYKVYEAQDVSLEERIEVLEELKKRDYREKWAYTLAYLYHRIGLATKCVEECDELILWFGDGKYVYKAMELKMLHQPLTPQQQSKYDSRFDGVISDSKWEAPAASRVASPIQNVPTASDNLSNEAAKADNSENAEATTFVDGDTKVITSFDKEKTPENIALALGYTQVYHGNTPEPEINVKQVDVSDYNTINLQKVLAEGVQEVLEEKEIKRSEEIQVELIPEEQLLTADTKEIPRSEKTPTIDLGNELPPDIAFAIPKDDEMAPPSDEEEEAEDDKNAFAREVLAPMYVSDTTAIDTEKVEKAIEESETIAESEDVAEKEEVAEEVEGEEVVTSAEEIIPDKQVSTSEKISGIPSIDEYVNPSVVKEALSAQPPEQIASVLRQEDDGQISLVVPEKQQVTKQITGQININDVMNEWARMKREREEINRQQYHDQIRQQTGEIFDEFEAAALNGVLETLEKEDAKAAKLAKQGLGLSQEAPSETEISEEYSDNDEFAVGDAIVEEPAEEYAEDFSVGEPAAEAENTFEEETFDVDTSDTDEYSSEYEQAEVEENAVSEDDSFNETSEAEYNEGNELAESFDVEEGSSEYAMDESEGEYYEETSEAVAEEASEEPVEETEEISEELPEESAEETEEARDTNAVIDSHLRDVLVKNRSREIPDYYKKKIEASKKPVSEEEDFDELRPLTKEEIDLFGPYIQNKSSRKQLIKVIDGISMASFTGNVILSGGDGTDTFDLATALLKDIKQADNNFSGKIAKITGANLNNKKVSTVVKQFANGALIIEKASHLSEPTAMELYRALDTENFGIIVVLLDTERNMDKLLSRSPKLSNLFTARMNLKPLTAEQLASFAIKYAYEKEYSIDEMGMLALHTQINARQTSTHSVNVVEVREIIDNAIAHVNRKSIGHFFDVLFGKRYDNEDMIILGEKDFQ